MPALSTLLNPRSFPRLAEKALLRVISLVKPSYRALSADPPGHFYSPLLDLKGLSSNSKAMDFDGAECWEFIDLRAEAQRGYYRDLVQTYPMLDFPKVKSEGYRYFLDNPFFVYADAFTLSGVIRREKPRRIIEVGSGFSSAVMLDTLVHSNAKAELTFIEPFPDRLQALLSPAELAAARVLAQPVQTVPMQLFEELEANDILFIDSSHVAKVGSDLTFLLLRILPRLRPGVLVHFHDLFYPNSYPMEWIRNGRAWNESIFLRAFLINNQAFEIVAFNCFAGLTFPELFRDANDRFLANSGGSLWLRSRG